MKKKSFIVTYTLHINIHTHHLTSNQFMKDFNCPSIKWKKNESLTVYDDYDHQ